MENEFKNWVKIIERRAAIKRHVKTISFIFVFLFSVPALLGFLVYYFGFFTESINESKAAACGLYFFTGLMVEFLILALCFIYALFHDFINNKQNN